MTRSLRVTRAFILVAAAASLALMYRAGHRNPSAVLILMFAVWVVSPFVALDVINRLAQRWSFRGRSVVRVTTVVIAAGAVSVYGTDALRPVSSKGAFIYLVVPFVSWVVVVIVGAIAGLSSGPDAPAPTRPA